MAAILSKPIRVRELADAWGVSVWTVRRSLHRLERRAGGVIHQDSDSPNAPISTTLRALRNADPRLVELRELNRDEMLELKKKRSDDARRIKSLETQVKHLRDALSHLLNVEQHSAA